LASVFAGFGILCGTYSHTRKVGGGQHEFQSCTLVRTVVIFFVTVAIISMRCQWIWPKEATIKPLTFLVLSGISTGLSWLCYYRALQLAPASLVAPIDKLSVAFAIALGILVLGEPITWRIALGGGLVVAGALVVASS
jgi:transporter family protein